MNNLSYNQGADLVQNNFRRNAKAVAKAAKKLRTEKFLNRCHTAVQNTAYIAGCTVGAVALTLLVFITLAL